MGHFPDGLTYTFHLRDGVKFHTTPYFKPTRAFNADDVLFTFNRMIDKDEPFRKAYPTEFPYFTDMGMDTNITKIEKSRRQNRQVHPKDRGRRVHPEPGHELRLRPVRRVRRQLLKEGKAADINQKPVGTGPFVFKSYQKDSNIRYTGNKDYWKPDDVKIDNLIFAITTDPSVRIQKLKKSECQITLFPRPADLKALKEDKDLKVPEPGRFQPGLHRLQRDGQDQGQRRAQPDGQTSKVRQALDMAVNKQQIIDSVYQGAGQLAVNAMPPTQWSYDTTIKDAQVRP